MNQFAKYVLPVGAVLVGLAGAAFLIMSKPKAKRTERPALPPLVDVIRPAKGGVVAEVSAMGTVVPARQVELQAEVSGRVRWVNKNLVKGGRIKKGEVLIRLDAQEYALALEQQKASVQKAEVELAMERGRRKVAEKEWELLKTEGEGDGKALALRQPQLRSATAGLAAAKSALERAKLNIARTVVRAPFNVFVSDEFVEIDQLVTPQARLASLMGTDHVWVQVPVPMSQLGWMKIPGIGGDEGSTARVVLDVGQKQIVRHGRVARLMGDLDPRGRLARVIIEVSDPMPEGELPLMVNAYVNVKIQGPALANVVSIPRTALREASTVWVVTADRKLQIRVAEVVRRTEESVFIGSGLRGDEAVVVSRLPTAVDGMDLRVSGDKSASGAMRAQKPAPGDVPANKADDDEGKEAAQ